MSPVPSAAAAGLADRWRLALSSAPRGGIAGARLGRGTGASLEFEDRRSYVAGDDVRHLDWRAFARTGELMIKLHREEIAPRVEVLLDGSRSMAAGGAKSMLAVDLCALLLRCAGADGFAAACILAGEACESIALERFEREGVEFEARARLGESLRGIGALLRPGALRIVISDFLFPHDAAALLRTLRARAGALCVVQVLSAEDAAPVAGEALRLIDSETGETLDLVVDERGVQRYRERLQRLTEALEQEARRSGSQFVRIVADRSLEASCRDHLAPAGLLQPG